MTTYVETRPAVIRRSLLKLADFLEKLPRKRFRYDMKLELLQESHGDTCLEFDL